MWRMSTPASISWVAAVWRSMCGVTRAVMPAARAAFARRERMAGAVSGSKLRLNRSWEWPMSKVARAVRYEATNAVIQSLVRNTVRSRLPLPIKRMSRPRRSMLEHSISTASLTRTPVATISATPRKVVDSCGRLTIAETLAVVSRAAVPRRKANKRSSSWELRTLGSFRDRPNVTGVPIQGSSASSSWDRSHRQNPRSPEVRRRSDAGESPADCWRSRKSTRHL